MALALPANSVTPRLADRSDDQLMMAYARKDSAAFDELYSRYKGALYGYLVKNCWVSCCPGTSTTGATFSRSQDQGARRAESVRSRPGAG